MLPPLGGLDSEPELSCITLDFNSADPVTFHSSRPASLHSEMRPLSVASSNASFAKQKIYSGGVGPYGSVRSPHRQSVEPIYESLKSLQQPPPSAASQNGLSKGLDTASLKSAPLQRSPAVHSMRNCTEADDLAAQIEICQGMAKTLDDFSKTVRDQCHLVSNTASSVDQLYQHRQATTKSSSEKEIGQLRKPEQQQQQTTSGFTRRNSKKITPSKTHNGSSSHYQVSATNKSNNNDLVYTKTTTYVEVSEPQVTVTEKVVASKVTNIVEPSALNLMSSNGGSLPFIDESVRQQSAESTLQTKLRGLDKQMEDDLDEVFVDAHDDSIDAAIMEAAGVDDNTDKMVESIQIKGQRQDSIKDSRSS